MLRTTFAIALAGTIGWFGAGQSVADELKIAETLNGMPLVFSDDFEQGTSHWETTDDESWELGDRDDGKVFSLIRNFSMYKPKVASPLHIALIKDVKVSDFVLLLEVKSTRDTGAHRDCCLFFNHQDPTHFYYVHLGAHPDPHSGQIMIVDGKARVALTENENLTPWDDEWHLLKVVRDTKEGVIEVYFDDMETPHMRAVDRTFGEGRVGIGSFDDRNDFDNVRLYGR